MFIPSVKAFSKYTPQNSYLCVDLELFDGALQKTSYKALPFITGKTCRDYATLVKAAKDMATEIRIIGPSTQKPEDLPSNVKWIDIH